MARYPTPLEIAKTMRNACIDLKHQYENPNTDFEFCPLCRASMLLTHCESALEYCRVCPHHTIDGSPIEEWTDKPPCVRNRKVKRIKIPFHPYIEEYDACFRLVRRYKDDFCSAIHSRNTLPDAFEQRFALVRRRHIRRMEQYISFYTDLITILESEETRECESTSDS